MILSHSQSQADLSNVMLLVVLMMTSVLRWFGGDQNNIALLGGILLVEFYSMGLRSSSGPPNYSFKIWVQ